MKHQLTAVVPEGALRALREHKKAAVVHAADLQAVHVRGRNNVTSRGQRLASHDKRKWDVCSDIPLLGLGSGRMRGQNLCRRGLSKPLACEAGQEQSQPNTQMSDGSLHRYPPS